MKFFYKKINFILLILSFTAVFYFIFSKPTYKPKQFSEHVKGFPNATVTLIIYGEYQCFRTRNFWKEILPKLEEDYIKTGKIKLIYKHHPKLFFNYSLEAAEAAECAADQGKFWEYVELLFERTSLVCGQAGSGLGLSPSDLKNYAKELGLDTKMFNSCLDSGVMLYRIQSDMEELHKKGIWASGVVFINGEMLSGNWPYNEFQSRIEKFLKQ